MAINIEKLRERLDVLKTSNNRTKGLWKPKPGKHKIRILPNASDLENPFTEMYFHYGTIVPKKTIVSPKSYGNPDPVEEMGLKLKGTGDQTDWKLGNTLVPKQRTYARILVRGQESEGVLVWGFSKQIFEALLDAITDEDEGSDITDLKEGRDVIVNIEAAEEGGKNKFPTITVKVSVKATHVSDDAEVLAMIKNQPKMEELFPEPTYEELKGYLQTWADAAEETSDRDTEAVGGKDEDEEEVKPAKAAAKKSSKKVDQSEVANKFADVFDDEE